MSSFKILKLNQYVKLTKSLRVMLNGVIATVEPDVIGFRSRFTLSRAYFPFIN